MTATTPFDTAELREVREAARRHAQALSAGLATVLGTIAALAAVSAFAVLDYHFNQAAHRLVKILIGAAAFGGVLAWPRVGLLAIPIVTPFLPWLPMLRIPGLNPQNVLLGSVFLTWALARVLNRQDVFRPGRLGAVIGAVVALAALSVVRGAAVPTGYEYPADRTALVWFRSSVAFSVYFITLAMARGERDRRRLTWAVTLGLLAEAACTILYGRNGRGGRAVGSIGQSNELGAFLALYTVMVAALLPAVRRWFARLTLLGMVTAGAYATILSVSRGAIVAMVLGLLYVGFKSSRILTLLFVAVLLTGPLWAPDYLKERMTGTQRAVEGTDEMELENSAQLRVDTWKATMTVIGDHPIDGVGFAGLAYVLPDAGEALGLEVKDSSHNTFLRFLAEMGVFGLGLFCFLLWKCWALARDAGRAARTPFDRQMCVGLSAAVLALAVSCLFGDRFFNIAITGSFWMICALADDILLGQRPAPLSRVPHEARA